MYISNAELSDGKLVLTADASATRFVYGFTAGDYEIVKQKKKRSLDANAYAWVLIDKIAHAVRMPKIDVYRNAIRDIGGVSDIVCIKEKAVDSLIRGWIHNGLGWQTETLPSKIQGCTNVVLYYGSSVYDKEQMSVFISKLEEDAKALGIETLPPEKLAAMVDEWQ